ncbi:CYTH and CHAD domain-containing protein [Rhodococcus sp. Z13]|uniref:CYTH and CHAD domain-containing protein n=1 Tax=Rhodococcus sacchari TaxID=2962047 RepID=A0ACD4DHU9_9NOCA|nr:CYTH and CHAD domain-containing protein [Rhodococcus sp. Z13]UYP19649.1 CYTH and CHAD domain-containing protein [Rhodococcus sp. Z13]
MPSPGSVPTAADESERKYATSADRPVPDLRGLPGTETIDVDRVELSAQYHDTADLRLLRSGITLRRREGGDDAGWHLKLPAGQDTRTELHFPLGSGTENVPDELAGLLRGIRRDAPLTLAALLTTNRERHRLRTADGDLVAEIVVDDVVAVRGPDAGEITWREIEIEWNPERGGKKVARFLEAVESRFEAAGITRADSPSKLHRALGDLVPGTPRLPKGLAAVHDYLAGELRTLALADVAVRRDEADSVHSMRKAARRLRSALQTYAGRIPADHDLVDELRWLGRRLSASRDLEVQWERLAGRVEQIPLEAHREATRARIDEYFSARSEAARTEVLDTLDSARYLDLLRRLDAAVAGLESTPGKGTGPRKVASKDLTRAVEKVAEKVGRRVAKVGAATDPARRDEAIHRVRKGAKRLRYATEAIAPLHPGEVEGILDRFDAFQDLLGEFQDSVVARGHLLDMVSEQGHTAETSFGLGILFHLEAGIGEQLAGQLDGAWKKTLRATRGLWS